VDDILKILKKIKNAHYENNLLFEVMEIIFLGKGFWCKDAAN